MDAREHQEPEDDYGTQAGAVHRSGVGAAEFTQRSQRERERVWGREELVTVRFHELREDGVRGRGAAELKNGEAGKEVQQQCQLPGLRFQRVSEVEPGCGSRQEGDISRWSPCDVIPIHAKRANIASECLVSRAEDRGEEDFERRSSRPPIGHRGGQAWGFVEHWLANGVQAAGQAGYTCEVSAGEKREDLDERLESEVIETGHDEWGRGGRGRRTEVEDGIWSCGVVRQGRISEHDSKLTRLGEYLRTPKRKVCLLFPRPRIMAGMDCTDCRLVSRKFQRRIYPRSFDY